MRRSLPAARDEILRGPTQGAQHRAAHAGQLQKRARWLPRRDRALRQLPTMYAGLVDAGGVLRAGTMAGCNSKMRRASRSPRTSTPRDYATYIGEASQCDSYLKAPYYKPLGYPGGDISRRTAGAAERGGPSAARRRPRRNSSNFVQRFGPMVHSSFHYHYARLIEADLRLERMEMLLADARDSGHARARPRRRELARRGRHHRSAARRLDPSLQGGRQGRHRWANLIVATGHNNLAMNRSVEQVARHFVDGNRMRGGNAQPRVGRGARVRSLPELLHACGRHAGVGVDAIRPGRQWPRSAVAHIEVVGVLSWCCEMLLLR